MGTLVLQPLSSMDMPPPAFSNLGPPPQQIPQFAAPQPQPYPRPSFGQVQQLQHPQPQQQQQQQHKSGPARSFQQGLKPTRRGGKKRGGKNRWHGARQHDSAAPSLASLSAQNRQGTQQHFGQLHDTPQSEPPRTAPHAPHNDNSFILSQHSRRSGGAQKFDSPAMTPSQPSGDMLWTPAHSSSHGADLSSLDKDAADLGAQLDFFGTNEGLVTRYSSEDESSDGGDSDGEAAAEAEQHERGWHLRHEDSSGAGAVTGGAGLPPHVKARLASQSAYIQQLEQQNLDLQEKYSLLQHELQELKAARATAAQTHLAPAEEQHEQPMTEEPAVAADVGASHHAAAKENIA